MHHGARVLGLGRSRILIHEPGQEILVEASPIDADADGFAVAKREVDDRRELLVALVLEPDIAGIDTVFGERLGAGRMLGKQRVAIIVEVADERHVDATRIQPLADMGHRCGGLGAVHGDAHELRARAGERGQLRHRRLDIGGVGIGH